MVFIAIFLGCIGGWVTGQYLESSLKLNLFATTAITLIVSMLLTAVLLSLALQ